MLAIDKNAIQIGELQVVLKHLRFTTAHEFHLKFQVKRYPAQNLYVGGWPT